MLGILTSILGNGEVIKKGMDLIDDIHTSETESIEAKTQAKVALMNSYAPFKVAQRYLALMFCGTFLVSFIVVMAMTLFGEPNIEAIKQVIDDFYIGEIALAIIGFYFGGGMLEGVISKTKEKSK